MFVPGSPSFARRRRKWCCASSPRGDGFRTVALGFSAFRVGGAAPGGATPDAHGRQPVGARRPGGAEPARERSTPSAPTAGTVTGVRRAFCLWRQAAAAAAAGSSPCRRRAVHAARRRHPLAERPTARSPIHWYHNTLDGVARRRPATPTPRFAPRFRAWTDPTNASIELNLRRDARVRFNPDSGTERAVLQRRQPGRRPHHLRRSAATSCRSASWR